MCRRQSYGHPPPVSGGLSLFRYTVLLERIERNIRGVAEGGLLEKELYQNEGGYKVGHHALQKSVCVLYKLLG